MNAVPHVVAVIPARGGSKRIPRKNLQLFRGKPLLVHSIEDALAARRVHRTIVSTDDEEIGAVSRSAGAEVIVRPAALATDTASSEEALLHVLDQIRSRGEREPDLMVFLQCTSPAREPSDIDAALHVLESTGADSLLSATRFNKYIWRVENGAAAPINYDFRHRWREQDFPEQFMENGSIYVFRTRILRTERNRLGGRIAIYEMKSEHSFQIDEPHDLPQGGRS